MSEELQRRRHRRERPRSPVVIFLKTYWVEIAIVLGLLLSVFLAFERMNIRGTLFGLARTLGSAGATAASRFVDSLTSLPTRIGLSELIAIPLFFTVLGLLFWRVRWRLQRTPALVDLQCPRCGGAIHRIHRRTVDHLLSVIVPVRRYHCANRECGWTGVKVSTHSHRGRSRSKAAAG
jgi:hypothetical protein